MKTGGKRYREEQIIYALQQVEKGKKVQDVCEETGISAQTYRRWKRQYAGMGSSEMRRLKQLEEENAILSQMVANLSLRKYVLEGLLSAALGLPLDKCFSKN